MMPIDAMSRHAHDRARTRRIPLSAVDAALLFGQRKRRRGAEVYVLGWRAVRRSIDAGVDLARYEGTQVVCAHDGTVLTVYRNRRSRPGRGRARGAA